MMIPLMSDFKSNKWQKKKADQRGQILVRNNQTKSNPDGTGTIVIDQAERKRGREAYFFPWRRRSTFVRPPQAAPPELAKRTLSAILK